MKPSATSLVALRPAQSQLVRVIIPANTHKPGKLATAAKVAKSVGGYLRAPIAMVLLFAPVAYLLGAFKGLV